MFKIDDNVPMPAVNTRVREKGPFALTAAALEVGKSFFAPGRKVKSVYAALSPKKNDGKTFRVAADTVDGETGVRVWRKS